MSRGGRYPKGETGQRQFTDDARQAAYDVCAAVRALDHMTSTPGWRADTLTRPAIADLTDARIRLDAILAQARPSAVSA